MTKWSPKRSYQAIIRLWLQFDPSLLYPVVLNNPPGCSHMRSQRFGFSAPVCLFTDVPWKEVGRDLG